MRWINIFAALSGVVALTMLAASHHLRSNPDFSFVLIAALAQLSAAAACLAISNRSGRLNLVAGALMLIGAGLFAGEIYWSSFDDNHPFHMLAPVGGSLLMLGWIVLAFTKPSAKT